MAVVGAAPFCVTVKVCSATVIVPVRATPAELAATEKLTVPLPAPEAPDVIVMKLGTLLTALQSHCELVVTLTLLTPPVDGSVFPVEERVNEHIDCFPAMITLAMFD